MRTGSYDVRGEIGYINKNQNMTTIDGQLIINLSNDFPPNSYLIKK